MFPLRFSRQGPVLVGVAALSALVGLGETALAQKEFPGAVRDALDMSCVPPCTICHETPAGGFGTLKGKDELIDGGKPGLGGRLRDQFGLAVGNISTVESALLAAEAAGSDVDADGTPDVQELREGTDPNSADGGSLCGPEYGCARVEPRGRVDGAAGVAALLTLVGGVSLARRRRAAPPRR